MTYILSFVCGYKIIHLPASKESLWVQLYPHFSSSPPPPKKMPPLTTSRSDIPLSFALIRSEIEHDGESINRSVHNDTMHI